MSGDSRRIGLQLGDFQLVARVGEGALGQVWRGTHRNGHPVAIKVLMQEHARKRSFLKAFQQEARTLAGLDHPHIVRVFDFGQVSPEDAARSEGLLPAKSPYLVMEFARGGTLVPWRGAMSWSQQRAVLLEVLDALAHAHARGVIHRDLKPENLLLSDLGDPSSSLRLADFGIARLLDGDLRRERQVAGTPLYVAPEQRTGDARSQGPWTDLFALGRVALALAGYELTLGGYAGEARHPVPGALLGWISRLTQAAPRQRYRSAAEARAGLLALPSEVAEAQASGTESRPQPFEDPADNDTIILTSLPELPRVPAPPPTHDARRALPTPIPIEPIGLPRAWRAPQSTALRPRLRGLGLERLGLQRAPTLGRLKERDQLWAALREVAYSRRPALTLLRGEPGVGKSQLAAWLASRSHELAGVPTLHVRDEAQLDDADALSGAFRRALQLQGLAPEAALNRIKNALESMGATNPLEWTSLAHALRPTGLGEVELKANERRAVLSHALRRLAGERVVVLNVGALRAAPSIQEFIAFLLQSPSPPAVLVIASDEEPATAMPSAMAKLFESPAAQEILVGPLPMEEHASLIRDLLGLEGSLAAWVAERTGGNPLFAVQLVGDWVQRGLLETGVRGHTLRPGQAPALPDALSELWSSRLEQLLSEELPSAGEALEIAAALGASVDEHEWDVACAVAGLKPPLQLVERLHDLGLARDDDEATWSFAHGMLRSALEERARAAGRWRRAHRAIVQLLMTGFTDHNVAHHHAERVGRHLRSAGMPEEAISHLSRGLDRRVRVGDYAQAELLLGDLTDTMRAIVDRPDDSRWGEHAILEARVAKALGRRDELQAALARALKGAETYGWARTKVKALQLSGDLRWQRGDSEAAVRFHRQALLLAGELKDSSLTATSRLALGVLLRRRGEVPEARERYREAAEDFRAHGDRIGEGYSLLGLAESERSLSRFTQAQPLLAQALACFEAAGAQRGTADVLNSMGELARQRGLLDDCLLHYAGARDRFRVIGSPMALAPEANLGLVLIEQGRFAEARQVLLDVIASLDRGEGPRAYKGYVHAYLLPCTAAVGDWSGFDRHAMAARVLLKETGEVEEDVARLAEEAGELALKANKPYHAKDALELALQQRQGLKEPARVTQLERRIASIQLPA